jgi:3-hydroxy-9,10-secoandrosta-1,3,5(10)-triene-9,17-dione monooxygenase
MTADELVGRAERLVPVVRERAVLADQLRRLPDDTVNDFADSGLFKALVPLKRGGYQFDHRVVARIVKPIASACGSSAWCLAVYCGHNWLAATLQEEVQRDIYGDAGFALIPAPLNPAGSKAQKIDGGFRVSGRWPFATGVHHSNWAILPALVREGDVAGETAQIVFAIPRADFEIDDTWHVEGMRGTGSKDIVIDNVFIPAHRTTDAVGVLEGKAPGTKVNPGSLYRLPAITSLLFVVEPVLTGITLGAIATYEKRMQTRVHAFTAHKDLDHSASQMRLAEACASVDAAELITNRDIDEMTRSIESGDLTIEQRARVRLDSAYVASLCKHAVDLLVDSAGANALRDGSELQRAFRDIHMLATHHFFEFDGAREIYGKARLALETRGFPM